MENKLQQWEFKSILVSTRDKEAASDLARYGLEGWQVACALSIREREGYLRRDQQEILLQRPIRES